MFAKSKRRALARNIIIMAALTSGLAACGERAEMQMGAGAAGAAEDEFERGAHQGRMLREGDFALEITVFETGVPPEFRVYPTLDDRPLDPAQIRLTMAVSRLGGQVDRFVFVPQQDYLRAQSVLVEPHSFDVSATAEYDGQRYDFEYASYEGRTTIARDVADTAGVVVEAAGSAEIAETIDLVGRVELLPEGRAEIRAWYPGRIVEMAKIIGDTVRRGEMVARVEARDSLQIYAIPAPFAGVVVERYASVGGLADAQPLYVIMDPTQLHAEFFLFPQDVERVQVGQSIAVRSVSGDARFESTIEVVLSRADAAMPIRIAHVEIPAGDDRWWPGMGIEGMVTVATEQVPLAVRTPALQRFRDFTVVYARFGDTYEVRMLELGRRTPEWTEVLGGLEPGTPYVTDNAFLIRADVEKSGAVHDH